MPYADLLRSVTADLSDAALLLEGIWSSNHDAVLTAWSPTTGAGGAMTFTSVTIGHARYIRCGKLCLFSIRVSGTVGGTPNGNLTITLPFTSRNGGDVQGGGCLIYDSTTTPSNEVGAWYIPVNSSTLTVLRQDALVWGAGTAGYFINGWYEVN